MKKQKIRFAIFMLLLAVTACDNADYSKSAPFDNGVYLSVAESKTSETMTFNKTIIQREKSFTARLAYHSWYYCVSCRLLLVKGQLLR